jgi:hypothetical protein
MLTMAAREVGRRSAARKTHAADFPAPAHAAHPNPVLPLAPNPAPRQGKMLLELAPSAGERSYNWDQKITLAMSATELGTIFAEPHKVGGGGRRL